MDSNGYLANVRLWISNITWVHMHAQFEEDLLNTSAVISKTIFE